MPPSAVYLPNSKVELPILRVRILGLPVASENSKLDRTGVYNPARWNLGAHGLVRAYGAKRAEWWLKRSNSDLPESVCIP